MGRADGGKCRRGKRGMEKWGHAGLRREGGWDRLEKWTWKNVSWGAGTAAGSSAFPPCRISRGGLNDIAHAVDGPAPQWGKTPSLRFFPWDPPLFGNMKKPGTIQMAILADVAGAGLLLFCICLQVFLISREQKSLRLQASEESAAVADLPWAGLQAEFFRPEAKATESTYAGPTVAITMRSFSRDLDNKHALTYHVADIRVADVRCIRTALAHDRFGVGIQEPILGMMERTGALVAMNGDYYSYQNGGLVIRNGEVFRAEPTDADIGVLFLDGRLETFPGDYDLSELVRRGAWQAWTFGPSLLDERGRAVRPEKKGERYRYLRMRHPRSAFGYISPGHYCFVVCDGRSPGYSNGAKPYTLAQIMEGLGCRVAYNLDGGNSSLLAFRDALWNRPSGEGREISDCVFVKEFAP